jgi:hypothetical protein
MPKIPAAEEPITITFKLPEAEIILRALHTKQKELEGNGERSERALSVLLEAKDKTSEAIDNCLALRKERDH